MLAQNNYKLETGSWIKGKAANGALVIGYVETVDFSKGMVDATVVTSDNEEIIGETIELLDKWVKPLPISAKQSEEQLLSLIDLALTTRDKDWFIELSSKLTAIRSEVAKRKVLN